AENGKEIPLRVAHHAAVLQVFENGFEAHDGAGLGVAVGASAGLEERPRGILLKIRHLFQRQSLARGALLGVLPRRKVPVETLVVIEGIARLGLLLPGQTGEEFIRGTSHAGAAWFGSLADI